MNFVLNCFNFTLKGTCYFSDGKKVEIEPINSEEVIKVIRTTEVDSITLMGPRAFTERIAKEIKEEIDIDIYIMGATYE
jgi:carbamoylphosphate synthase large subunit